MSKRISRGRDQARRDLLVACARMFYEERRTKSQIAKEFSVSNTQVKRLLDEAAKLGIVRISIVEHTGYTQLEQELESKFRLRRAVVTGSSTNYEQQKSLLGTAAADLFMRSVREEMNVGVGGGSTLKAMVDHIPLDSRSIHVAPMALVGRGPILEHVDSAFLASLLCYKSAPKARASVVGMLPLPADQVEQDQFIAMIRAHVPEVQQVLDQARASTLCFVGLGGSLSAPELAPLLARSSGGRAVRKAAGGINYNYFDSNGSQVLSVFATVSIPELRAMSADPEKMVVLVAGGGHKIKALQIALISRMANALVTDERAALRLLGTGGPDAS